MVVANLIAIGLAGYLLGSISTSVLVSRLFYRTDIRQHGSENAGATNVFRVFGWKPALLVFVVDVGKGFLPALIAPDFQIAEMELPPVSLQLLAGTAATIGHSYPVFAGFRGGKGVATAGGTILAIHPLAVLICLSVFIAAFVPSRIVSVSSMAASVSMPAVLLVLQRVFGHQVSTPTLATATLLAVFIVFTHRSNISRLRQGKENRFGKNKNK